MDRERLSLSDDSLAPRPKRKSGGAYFAPPSSVRLFSSGCQLLDCALGGGWPEGKIVNIVGDKCLSGDTIVSVQRGVSPKKMTLRTLFNRFTGNHPNRNANALTYLVADVGGYVGLTQVSAVSRSCRKRLYAISDDRGNSLKASEDHLFHTDGGWGCLADGMLRVGTPVRSWRSARGVEVSRYKEHYVTHAEEMPANTKAIELSKIVSIQSVDSEITYDVTVEEKHHNFIASGFVVHNSTGKTLLAIEASANFAKLYRDSKIFYRETEAAFDSAYAESLGLPVGQVKMKRTLHTVEDVFEDITSLLDKYGDRPSLYILDSLDAVSDRAEQARGIDESTYGGNKPKQMGQLFRRLTRKMDKAKMTLCIVSQVRDNIGVAFGEKHTRTGGRALDFYASQIVWLAHMKQLKRTINKVERVVGVQIRAKVKKNKIGPPFREADFPILFSYGIDDVAAACDWLKTLGRGGPKAFVDSGFGDWKEYGRWLQDLADEEYALERRRLARAVKVEWARVEATFAPTRRKY